MHEKWARADLRPNQPTAFGYLMRSQGVPFRTVWSSPEWWRLSYQSLYGLFGYWKLSAAPWAYHLAGYLLLFSIACTYLDFIRRRAAYPSLMRLMLLVAPCAL